MALSSQITVSIKAIVAGLPEVKELTNNLKTLKGAGVTANLFAGIERALPGIAGLSQGFAGLGKNAQGAGLKLKVVNSETAKGNKAVLTLSQSADKTKKSFLGLSGGIQDTNASMGPLSVSASGLASVFLSLGKAIVLVGGALAALAAGAVGLAFKTLIENGIEFNKMLETAKVSISAILSTAGKIFEGGKQLAGIDAINAGLELAEGSLERLRKSAALLGISFEGVIRSFTEGLGPGLRQAGLTLEQLERVVPKIALAAQTIGLPVDQFAQEIRAIFSGDIDREARVAKLLEITPADMQRLKGKSDELFNFLEEKLRGFAAAGPIVAKTWTGVFVLIADQAQRAAGEATKGLFEATKNAAATLLGGILDKTTGEFTPAVTTIIKTIDALLAELGATINRIIQGAINLLNELAADTESLNTILGSIRAIVVGIVKFVMILAGGITEGKTRAQQLASVFKFAFNIFRASAIAVAAIVDLFRAGTFVAKNWALVLAGAMVVILEPLGWFNEDMAKLSEHFKSVAVNIMGAIQNHGAWNQTLSKTLTLVNDLEAGIGKIDFAEPVKKAARDLSFIADPLKPDAKKDKKGRKPEQTFAEPVSERELRAAEIALTRSHAEALRRIEEAKLDQREDMLDDYHSESLINIEAYWDSREQILRARAQNELTAIDEQIDDIKRLQGEAAQELAGQIAAVRADPKEQNKDIAIKNLQTKNLTEQLRLDAQLNKLEGERVVINQKLTGQIGANTSAKTQELQAFEAQLVSIQSQIAESTGDVQGAFAVRRFELEKQIIQLKAQGNEEAARALQEQLELEQLLIDLEDNSIHLQQQELQLSIAEQEVMNQVAAGKISEFEGEKKIADIRERSNALLLETLRRMQMIAETAGDVSKVLEIEDKIKKLEGAEKKITTFAQKINSVFENAFAGLFDAFIDGTKKAGEAFRDFARDILSGIAKLIAQMLILAAIKAIFGAAGIGGAITSLLPTGGGFASGGKVKGPGTATSDSILARLSAGEYVINAQAVRLVGTDFLDQINYGKFRRFADGGLVSPETGGTGNPSVVVKNVNVFDPKTLFDAMSTPRGEKLFLNFVTRNRQQMRTILGG